MGAWPIRLLLLREVGGIQLRVYFAHYPRLIVSTVVMAVGVAAVRHEIAGIPAAAMVVEIGAGVILLAAAMQIVAPGLEARSSRRRTHSAWGGDVVTAEETWRNEHPRAPTAPTTPHAAAERLRAT